ncbi:hypothetical protein V6N11_065936 [Hibiscus sabdariffa]|uniref:Uncharacterized protein n=2 Tax=Hibiscus sabdariffa TaxID=183260 RepID=A0ABR2NUF4_9ROSI
MKCGKQQETEEIEFKETQKKKLVKSSSSLGISRKGCSVLAPSVPDFSETLRKENRKPPVTGAVELTFPGKNWSRGNDVPLSNSRGTKSANAGEKKGRLMITRNSFSAANGENRRRKISGNNKPVY